MIGCCPINFLAARHCFLALKAWPWIRCFKIYRCSPATSIYPCSPVPKLMPNIWCVRVPLNTILIHMLKGLGPPYPSSYIYIHLYIYIHTCLFIYLSIHLWIRCHTTNLGWRAVQASSWRRWICRLCHPMGPGEQRSNSSQQLSQCFKSFWKATECSSVDSGFSWILGITLAGYSRL